MKTKAIDQLSTLERIFSALADRTRLRLLCEIATGEVSVGDLCDALNESQPKVSRHLAFLKNAGLVDTRREGKFVYYAIAAQQAGAAEVLRATLAAAVIGDGGRSTSVDEPSSAPAVRIRDNTSAQADMLDDWRRDRDELEIYLL